MKTALTRNARTLYYDKPLHHQHLFANDTNTSHNVHEIQL